MLEHVDLHKDPADRQRYRKVDEIPFDFSRRRMSVVVARRNGEHVLICKGAVEEILVDLHAMSRSTTCIEPLTR